MKEDDTFCPSCGQALTAAAQKPVAPTPIISEQRMRPTGVTILAVLEVLGGLIFFGLGALLVVVAGLLGITGLDIPSMELFPAFLAGLLGIIGAVMVIIGIINFVIAYGYWTGRGWAWTIGLIFAILGIVIGLITLPSGIITLIINGLIVYYLTRAYVKRFFGKEPVTITV